MNTDVSRPGRRPLRLLSLVLLWFCLENLARIVLSLRQARELSGIATALSPYYVAAISAVWLCAFAGNLMVVWLRPEWTVPLSLSVMALYQANLWLNRLVFLRSSEATETTGFHAILTVASFAALAIGLVAARRGARNVRRET